MSAETGWKTSMLDPKLPPDEVVAYFRREFDAVSIGVKQIREELNKLKEQYRDGTTAPEVLLERMTELDKRAELYEARAEELEREFERFEQDCRTLH